MDPLIAKKKITDLSGQGLSDIESSPDIANSTTLILDDNELTNLSSWTICMNLEKLSLIKNHITTMDNLFRLSKLRVLNLQENKIERIEGLSRLAHLEWLNLSGNRIKMIENLKGNIMLRHLDISNNLITEFKDISFLVHLKTLHLENNKLKSLTDIPTSLPPSVSTLRLAGNQLVDLTEMQLLSCLPFLEELSLSGNPCLITDDNDEYIDYRPYVICCCKNISNLDSVTVTQADRHSAKILDAEGHLKMLQPGQHSKLAKYLLEAPPGYSPRFIQKKTSMTRKSDASGVNTSLLDSESVHLPIIMESPPKRNQRQMEESRPFTAPPSYEMRGLTWEDLLANGEGTIQHHEYTAKELELVKPLDSVNAHSLQGIDSIERGRQNRASSMPHPEAIGYKYTESSSDIFDENEAKRTEKLKHNSTEESEDMRRIVKSNTTEFADAFESTNTNTSTVQSSVSMTAEEALRLLNLAAAMIQAYVRGYIQRKRYHRMLTVYKAATKIQAAWRGYFIRNLDMRIVEMRRHFTMRKLAGRVSFLEVKLERVQAERQKDKNLISEIVQILVKEINTQRDQIDHLHAAKALEEKYRNEMHAICIGFQNEICHLKSLVMQSKIPPDVYHQSNDKDSSEVASENSKVCNKRYTNKVSDDIVLDQGNFDYETGYSTLSGSFATVVSYDDIQRAPGASARKGILDQDGTQSTVSSVPTSCNNQVEYDNTSKDSLAEHKSREDHDATSDRIHEPATVHMIQQNSSLVCLPTASSDSNLQATVCDNSSGKGECINARSEAAYTNRLPIAASHAMAFEDKTFSNTTVGSVLNNKTLQGERCPSLAVAEDAVFCEQVNPEINCLDGAVSRHPEPRLDETFDIDAEAAGELNFVEAFYTAEKTIDENVKDIPHAKSNSDCIDQGNCTNVAVIHLRTSNGSTAGDSVMTSQRSMAQNSVWNENSRDLESNKENDNTIELYNEAHCLYDSRRSESNEKHDAKISNEAQNSANSQEIVLHKTADGEVIDRKKNQQKDLANDLQECFSHVEIGEAARSSSVGEETERQRNERVTSYSCDYKPLPPVECQENGAQKTMTAASNESACDAAITIESSDGENHCLKPLPEADQANDIDLTTSNDTRLFSLANDNARQKVDDLKGGLLKKSFSDRRRTLFPSVSSAESCTTHYPSRLVPNRSTEHISSSLYEGGSTQPARMPRKFFSPLTQHDVKIPGTSKTVNSESLSPKLQIEGTIGTLTPPTKFTGMANDRLSMGGNIYQKNDDDDNHIRSVLREVTHYHGPLTSTSQGDHVRSGTVVSSGILLSRSSVGTSVPASSGCIDTTYPTCKDIGPGMVPHPSTKAAFIKETLRNSQSELPNAIVDSASRKYGDDVTVDLDSSGEAFDRRTSTPIKDEDNVHGVDADEGKQSNPTGSNQGTENAPLGAEMENPDNQQSTSPTSVSHSAEKDDKTKLIQGQSLHDVPDCLSSMPLLVPLASSMKPKESSMAMPLFLDQSYESVNSSFDS